MKKIFFLVLFLFVSSENVFADVCYAPVTNQVAAIIANSSSVSVRIPYNETRTVYFKSWTDYFIFPWVDHPYNWAPCDVASMDMVVWTSWRMLTCSTSGTFSPIMTMWDFYYTTSCGWSVSPMQSIVNGFWSGAISGARATATGPIGRIVYILQWLWIFIFLCALTLLLIRVTNANRDLSAQIKRIQWALKK